jgi:AcrR family transcriptional regulator
MSTPTEPFGQVSELRGKQGPMSTAAAAIPITMDSDKRRQIVEGARAVFLAQGFDAASMGEIARQAGVSKGTLYVYFDSKEALFQTIVHEQCQAQAEQVFSLDAGDHDVKSVLTRLGKSFVGFLCRPERVSPLRTIISISERMPAAGQQFYETGPATGIARVARYLEAQVAAGMLEIEDTEVAAAQFLESCTATLLKPILFGLADAPSQDRIDHVVGIAVRTFLAAYLRQ